MTNPVDQLATRLAGAGHWVSLDNRVTEQTAAELIGISTRTLRDWRSRGTGPAFVSAGRLTYRLTDILAFLDTRTHNPMA